MARRKGIRVGINESPWQLGGVADDIAVNNIAEADEELPDDGEKRPNIQEF